MAKPAGQVVRRQGASRFLESNGKRPEVSSPGPLQQRLEFAPCELYRIQLWVVGREVEDSGSGLLDRFSDADRSVSTQVVHDDQVAGMKRWRERLSHELEEGFCRRASLVGHHGPNSIERDGPYDCEYDATITGDNPHDSFSARASGVLANHRGVRTGFVHKNQTRRGEAGDRLAEALAPRRNSRGLAFLGDKGLFFRVKPSLVTALTIVDRETAGFCSTL